MANSIIIRTHAPGCQFTQSSRAVCSCRAEQRRYEIMDENGQMREATEADLERIRVRKEGGGG
jgi:hypothetical protein